MSEEATQDAGSQEVATQAVAESAAPVNFLDSLPGICEVIQVLRTLQMLAPWQSHMYMLDQ